MTENMKAFLTELAELMEKHRVTEIDVTEETRYGYEGMEIAGIEFTIDHRMAEGEYTPTEFFTIPGAWHTPNSIREDAEG